MVDLVEIALEPHPSSAGNARRALRRALEDIGASADVRETACLLVSEVVTNAVLHAGTPMVLRFSPETGGVRVEVEDGSAVIPACRRHDVDAMTGRGVSLVETLAARSGVEVVPGGKVVWFVVGDFSPDGADSPVAASPPETYTTRFIDIHVPMARASLAYGEAVLRELALLAMSGDSSAPDRWQPPRFNLAPLLDALERASGAGEARTTLAVDFPISAKDLALEQLALVEDGHELARQGKLLTGPAIPEVLHCRRWIYRQIYQQPDGAPPEPWVVPDDLGVEVDLVLDDADRALLDGDRPIVAASDANRIVFVNALAEAMIGASSDELVGRRLTALIPPEWRLAHLAGFARFQLTGESRIIGTTVSVPLLRGDGSVVDIDLRIDAIRLRGRQIFRATISPSTLSVPG